MSSTAFKVVDKNELKEEFDNPATPLDLYLKLFNNQEDCDVVFVVGPERERIWAHKAILKARSPYFKTRLSGRWEGGSNHEGEANEIVLEEDEPFIFRSFLEHIYAYLFKSSSVVEAVKLLHLARYFSVPSLAILCEEVLEQDFQPDDLLETLVLARRFCLTEVVRKASETMSNYFIQLAKSPTFEKADESTLIYLLKQDDLNVKEVRLFSILLRWADYQIKNSTEDPKPGRNGILKNLIPLIRFPTMEAKEFAEVVASTSILPVETKCNLLIYLNVGWDKQGKIARTFPFSTIPRKNDKVCIEFYEKGLRPVRETYSRTSLKRRSEVQDILTINVSDSWSWQCRVLVVSLVLEPPRYVESLFQNSLEVFGRKLPMSVAISLSEFNSKDSQQTWVSEEVVADLGNGQMILKFDKPRVLLFDESKYYKITTRFLSDVYAVPQWVGYGSRFHKSRRDENFDYFTANKLCERFYLGLGGFCYIERLSISGGTGASRDQSGVQATSVSEMSSGLHLIRSIQVVRI